MENIAIEHIQRGQAGSYEPHVYEARFTFTADRANGLPREHMVKSLAKVLLRSWNEDEPDASASSFYATRLKRMECVSQTDTHSVWHIRIETPYQD